MPRPEDAVLSDSMRETLKGLAEYCTLAVIRWRDLPDVRKLVGIGIIVRDEPRSTAAQYAPESPEEVQWFLGLLTGTLS